MIPRYQTLEIERIFNDRNRFALYIEIEALCLEALSKKHPITLGEIRALRSLKKKINTRAISRHEERTRHEITAFLAWIWERFPRATGLKRFLHLGLTSSDLLDTALSLQMFQALCCLGVELGKILKALEVLSKKHKDLITIGRTHGIHAEPTTLGLKFLGYYQEAKRNQERLGRVKGEISFGKLSGSVGSFASSLITPEAEGRILSHLGLRPEPMATQVIPRDRHASVLSFLALLAGWIERLATELRHLQRTEVSEAFEPFGRGQEGSSSMPHKRNPVLCENLCGLARLLRGHTLSGLENMALWHERDISHSSAERIIIPDAFHVSHFMLKRLYFVLSGLHVDTFRVKENSKILLDLPYSQQYLNQLVLGDMSRSEAYKVVRVASFAALKKRSSLWQELKGAGFKVKKVPENRTTIYADRLFARSRKV